MIICYSKLKRGGGGCLQDSNQEAEIKYDRLPKEFRIFAARVYSTLKGYEKHEARDHELRWFTSGKSVFSCYEEMPADLQMSIDRASETYAEDCMYFSLQLWDLMCDYCLTEKLCLEIARWLNSKGHVLDEGFDAAVKIISYYCGTEEKKALEFISKFDYKDLRAKYSKIHFSVYKRYGF